MTMYRHWKLERDAEGIAWLTFDKADASTNTLSADVFEELRALLAELAAAPPKGMVIRSGKENGFIAGADIDGFTQLKTVDDAIALVRRGWDAYNELAAVPYPTLALIRGFCLGGGLGAGTRVPLSRGGRRTRHPAGIARGHARHRAGMGRHAAPAQPRRRAGRARSAAYRQDHRREAREEARNRRRMRPRADHDEHCAWRVARGTAAAPIALSTFAHAQSTAAADHQRRRRESRSPRVHGASTTPPPMPFSTCG